MVAVTGTGPELERVTVMGAFWPTVMAVAIVVVALGVPSLPSAALNVVDAALSTALSRADATAVKLSLPDAVALVMSAGVRV
jgi:hypothetical protein